MQNSNTNSSIQTSSDGVAAVDRNYHWIPITADTPRGIKFQLINKADGIPRYDVIANNKRLTHYALIPTFAKD